MENKVDFSKPVQTRDGRKVRIFATDGGGEQPIFGATWEEDMQRWELESWAIRI